MRLPTNSPALDTSKRSQTEIACVEVERFLCEINRQAKSCMEKFEQLTLKRNVSKDQPELMDEMKPPFPNLKYLLIRNNELCEDMDLLPVAVWPCLQKVEVQGNPICRNYSGPPPLCKKLLIDSQRIEIIRNDSKQKAPKPSVCVPRGKIPKDHVVSKKHDIDKLLQEIRDAQCAILAKQEQVPAQSLPALLEDEDLDEVDDEEMEERPDLFLTEEKSNPFDWFKEETSRNLVPENMQSALCELESLLENGAKQRVLRASGTFKEKRHFDHEMPVEPQSYALDSKKPHRPKRTGNSSALGFGTRPESQQIRLQKERFDRMNDAQRERWLTKQSSADKQLQRVSN
ncbi:X-ray radiation resistance-associated protein 1 [Cichlidogyrus casuarinus]|uniref:X-ray radiation resistance-associated protein 1 n=1 Tax=Cichlidogyrus casuarinus TaxID=1844966 RepID=A0ABD2Q7A8_9PLAT